MKEPHADMVFLSMHLRFGQFRAPRNVDRRIPYATGNPAHLERRIADKWQCFQTIQNPLVQTRRVLPFKVPTAQIQMYRENMLTIEPSI